MATTKRVLVSLLLPLAVASAASGCVTGLLYHDVKTPLVTDMNQTPNPGQGRVAEGSSKRVSEPLTGFNIAVEVDSYAIGDAAKQAGLNEVNYADFRMQSYILGIWQEKTVIVHGLSSK